MKIDKRIVFGMAMGMTLILGADKIGSSLFTNPNADNIRTVKVEKTNNNSQNNNSVSNVSSQNTSVSSGITIHTIEPNSVKINNNKGTISFKANINGKMEKVQFETALVDIEDSNNSNNYTYQIIQDNSGNYTNTIYLPASLSDKIS